MSAVEEQSELFDKYVTRLQVVREIKQRQSVEFHGKFICALQSTSLFLFCTSLWFLTKSRSSLSGVINCTTSV